jgi:D-threonate/D-erythronate kinase
LADSARPLRILILADDLSGAADCGVACTRAGLDTRVQLSSQSLPRADAVAVDLATRGLPPAEAREAARDAARRLLPPGCLLYKKIDSTLRGHPGPEIAAALEGARRRGGRLALVAPAFPAMGRTARGGRMFVRGAPLEATETWRHEGRGVDPDLAAMLDRAGVPARVLPLGTVRSAGLADALRRESEHGGALVCDAETEEDLARIAAAGITLGPAAVWAGSAGLAGPLAALLARSAPNEPLPEARRRRGPVAVVVGSMSGVARAQIAALARLPGTRLVAADPAMLAAGAASPGWADAERALDEALAVAGDDGVVVATIGAGPADGVPGRPLCLALAHLVAPHAERIGGLVSTGGETARAVLDRAGAAELRLAGEVEPGVPLGMADGLPVVTKAGAFGDERTLVRCVEWLRGLSLAP